MKFFRLCRYDLVRNLLKKPGKWLVVAALSVFLFLNFSLDALHIFWRGGTLGENIERVQSLGLSFGDGMLYLTGGILPVTFTSLTDDLQFPVKWLLVHMLVLYITLNYTSSDLTRGGVQVLIRTGSRGLWWLSKCLWNVLTVLSCFAVMEGVWCLLTCLSGKTLDFSLNPELFWALFDEALPKTGAEGAEYLAACCILPALTASAVSLLQMTLTLYMKPVFAYMAVCAYYAAGVLYASPLFLSNYAMSARSAAVGIYNFRFGTGAALCLGAGIAAAGIGVWRIGKMDLVNLER